MVSSQEGDLGATATPDTLSAAGVRWLFRLDPELDAPAVEGPTIPADPLVRDGHLEGLRKRVGLQAEGAPVLPDGLEALPVELEALGVGRRALVLAGLVEADEKGEAVAQPQEPQVSVQVPDLFVRQAGPEPLLTAGLGLDETRLRPGPAEAANEGLIVHAAEARRIGVLLLQPVQPLRVGPHLELDRIVLERVRPAPLLVPGHRGA